MDAVHATMAGGGDPPAGHHPEEDTVAPDPIVERLARICLALPGAVERDGWQGVRWEVRGRGFAHVLPIDGGRPPAYAGAFATDGPATALTFWSRGPELAALRDGGPPFVAVPWSRSMVGIRLDPGGGAVDWTELAELLAESHRIRSGSWRSHP